MLRYSQFKSFMKSSILKHHHLSIKPLDNPAWTFKDVVGGFGVLVPVVGFGVILYDTFYLRPKHKQTRFEDKKRFEEKSIETTKKSADALEALILRDQAEDAIYEEKLLSRERQAEEDLCTIKEKAAQWRNNKPLTQDTVHSLFSSPNKAATKNSLLETCTDDELENSSEYEGCRPSKK